MAGQVRNRLEASRQKRPFIKENLLKLIDAANEYRGITRSDRVRIFAYVTSRHLVIIASTYLFGLAIHPGIQVTTLAWIRAVVTLALLRF